MSDALIQASGNFEILEIKLHLKGGWKRHKIRVKPSAQKLDDMFSDF